MNMEQNANTTQTEASSEIKNARWGYDLISVDSWKNAAGKTHKPVSTLQWNGSLLAVAYSISLQDMMMIVRDVAGSCFDPDTNEYLPEIRDFAFKRALIDSYTNMEIPDDISVCYDLIYNTNIIPNILEYINPEQYNEMDIAINRRIQHMAHADVEMARSRSIDDVIERIKDFGERVGDFLGNISQEDIEAFLSALPSLEDDTNITKIIK